MPLAGKRETEGERRQRLLAGCFLEKVADEIDPSHPLIVVRLIMKTFYNASGADLYRKIEKPMRWGAQ